MDKLEPFYRLAQNIAPLSLENCTWAASELGKIIPDLPDSREAKQLLIIFQAMSNMINEHEKHQRMMQSPYQKYHFAKAYLDADLPSPETELKKAEEVLKEVDDLISLPPEIRIKIVQFGFCQHQAGYLRGRQEREDMHKVSNRGRRRYHFDLLMEYALLYRAGKFKNCRKAVEAAEADDRWISANERLIAEGESSYELDEQGFRKFVSDELPKKTE